MKKTRLFKALSLILCMVFIAAMALIVSGCNGGTSSDTESSAPVSAVEDSKAEVLGEGKTVFNFAVTFKNGEKKLYEIHTDKTTVGEALIGLELISGDEGAYGLYVKNVCGETLDYDTDKMYWSFYENGDYAAKGVDQTDITDGASYEFRAEKG